ncbi:MAG: hypothetical protein AB7I38_12715 [Dehalococcoidia bacterium]
MFPEAHTPSLQERYTVDDPAPFPEGDTFSAALDGLSLAEIEEAAGELHRRIAEALRDLGERRSDRGGRDSPRARVASLAVRTEIAAVVLAGAAAASEVTVPRLEVHPSAIAAVMYAAPTLPALLGRLEQDRRLLASLARAIESRLDEEWTSPWGRMSLRHLVTDVAIVRPAKVAMDLDILAGQAEV